MALLKKMIKALMCIEDLHQGTGTIVQVRKGAEYILNKISALTLVFSGDTSTSDLVYIKEVVDQPTTMLSIMTSSMTDIVKAAKGFADISGLVTANDGAGGRYFWNVTGDKATHDGLTIIDPTHTVTIGDAGWYTDENTGTTGTWVRIDYMVAMAVAGKAILKSFGTDQDIDIDPSGTGNINALANIKFLAGGGVDFSAQTPDGSGTTGSEVLDDYEEGTFTPVLEAGGVDVLSTGSPWTADKILGQYTKVGNRVDFTISFRVLVKDASISGAMTFSGLPFTQGISEQSTCSLFYHAIGSAGDIPLVRITNGTTAITLTQQPQSTSGSTSLLDTDIGASGSPQIAITGTYFI